MRMAFVMRWVDMLFCSWVKNRLYGLAVDADLPGDLAAGFAEGGGHGAVFVHGQFAGFFCLIGVDGAFQGVMDVDGFPEGGFFSFFAFAVDRHMKGFYGLSLFV